MSQIMYNYPAMLNHAADMSGYAGTMQGLGSDIASEQATLSNACQHPRGEHHVHAGPRPGRSRQMGRLGRD
jgi:uncharacterized protein YukE